jgi:hypothetical protein
MSLSIICPACKDLVPVIDRTISEHHECPAGGMRYVPSPLKLQSYAGGPKIELLAAKPIQCPTCEKGHAIAMLVKVTPPRAGLN